MAFQFDTSGSVRVYTNVGEPGGTRKRDWTWPDLSPFVQGYVEAMFASLPERRCGWCGIKVTVAARKTGFGCGKHPQCTEAVRDERVRLYAKGFSDLAPETLARIMEDCGRFKALHENAPDGGRFWATRQKGLWTHETFPPLTPYLGEDGKIHIKES